MPKNKKIEIKNARLHNLKNIDVSIERNAITVVTGVSGSGKSSLVFNTLYAEGQRRYVESLSSYARQFLGRLEKPEVDSITGLTPCIAIEQKVNTQNTRSTVATSTELYDYFKLLWARLGVTISPISGDIVKKHRPTDIVDYIKNLPLDIPVYICFEPKATATWGLLVQQGFSRASVEKEFVKIDDLPENAAAKNALIVVDRFISSDFSESNLSRIADSVEIAFWEGEGSLYVLSGNGDAISQQYFNNKFELDGITFEEPSLNLLSFNNPYGACKNCEGAGSVIGIDKSLVIPDEYLSVYNGAVVPWRGPTMREWQEDFIKHANTFNFPIHRSINELTEDELKILWNGSGRMRGINQFFDFLQGNSYKIQYRVMQSRYRGKTNCPECLGTRIRQDARHLKIINQGKNPEFLAHPHYASIHEILLLTINKAVVYFNALAFNEHDQIVAKHIFQEIKSRLDYLQKVGLGYLGLNRLSNSLSGGESQRINLATNLGSSLVGSTYVLDEPSIGLHSRDTQKLISVLQALQNKGNTIVVVEHDEEMMEAADYLVDIGPEAGYLGGEVVFSGNQKALLQSNSLTAQYLNGVEKITVPALRRKVQNRIVLEGANLHNLKNVNATIPLDMLVAVTGVSGSGKTTLIKNIFFPQLSLKLGQHISYLQGSLKNLGGDFRRLNAVEMVDQNPIGKSSRSNPATYIKAYDAIRDLFTTMPIARQRGYKPKHFSFNVDGGRCPKCLGEGEEIVEMQFMADLRLVCDECKGKKFKEEILEVTYNQKSIHDVLELTVLEAVDFFKDQKAILNKLQSLLDVGLGYVKLGQSSNTLSGGEAQRIKLATFLNKSNSKEKILFIFDEPTTGLHFHDIKKLLASFEALIKNGHSVVVIEHNMDVIKCADYVIDLGPDGGDKGGEIVFEGTPEELAQCEKSATAPYLAAKLNV